MFEALKEARIDYGNVSFRCSIQFTRRLDGDALTKTSTFASLSKGYNSHDDNRR